MTKCQLGSRYMYLHLTNVPMHNSKSKWCIHNTVAHTEDEVHWFVCRARKENGVGDNENWLKKKLTLDIFRSLTSTVSIDLLYITFWTRTARKKNHVRAGQECSLHFSFNANSIHRRFHASNAYYHTKKSENLRIWITILGTRNMEPLPLTSMDRTVVASRPYSL